MPNNVACVVFMCRTDNKQCITLRYTHSYKKFMNKILLAIQLLYIWRPYILLTLYPTNLQSTGNLKLNKIY